SAHPASSVAALAGYWVAHTTRQLDFEQAHRQSCLLVRVEDLTADAERAVADIGGFLCLSAGSPGPIAGGGHGPDGAAGLPLDQIPAPLLAQVNDLHRRLGYPPVNAAEA